MQASYWHEKWQKGETAFHQFKGSPLLKAHFSELGLPKLSRLLVPLCGKTRDIAWLVAHGHHVVAAELHEPAVIQLFNDMEIEPKVMHLGEFDLIHYQAIVDELTIDVYVGDIFQLNPALVGRVDGIYDRAALVALPFDMREKYTSHMRELTGAAPQLLISFDYEQHLLPGPPYCVDAGEVVSHYGEHYDISQLASEDVAGGLKGKLKANEEVWLLQKSEP
ncbi:thiopurine S-methyltransferase [Paraglaciecola mesophila]|jgi:thiopurine S-methyltransferase|uniref:Thiopurine S-methyltransferase n=1 Tax=Paraglaciecola mesophila TaxID=197222 RepID=A0ABU9SQN0_9ALTE|tara:strand:- start:3550 stop:4212 length:663 start_codon:yes stop_codon:yes gene_type:complete